MPDLNTLYGLPVSVAEEKARSWGYEFRTADYVSLRGKAGPDGRVLRARISGGAVEAVVGWFNTDIADKQETE